jgi:hypothetical protein
VGKPHVARAFARTPAVPEYQTDKRVSSLFVAETPRMGIKMSAHLASATSVVDGFALNSLVETDAMMKCRSRPTEIAAPVDACATDHDGELPPNSSRVLAIVAHELRGPLTPLRMVGPVNPQRGGRTSGDTPVSGKAASSRSSCRSSSLAALFMAAYKWKERVSFSGSVTLERGRRDDLDIRASGVPGCAATRASCQNADRLRNCYTAYN